MDKSLLIVGAINMVLETLQSSPWRRIRRQPVRYLENKIVHTRLAIELKLSHAGSLVFSELSSPSKSARDANAGVLEAIA
jgi:hypothetical protein